MDFVSFEIAKKLKEKGFSCQYPIAMYNERGDFHALYSSAGIENSYDYDFFDEHDCVCPTISQVLKWLRDEFSFHVSTKPYPCEDGLMWMYEVRKFNPNLIIVVANKTGFAKEEIAALVGIEYVLDNLI